VISLEVRHVEDSDWPELLQLERAEYGSHAFSVHTVRMLPVLFRSTCWVAYSDDLIGYCLAARVDQRPRCAWILAVVVTSSARGRGVGRALVNECLGSLRSAGATEVRLTVEPDNSAAIGLYETVGFTVKDTLREFYGAGEDRLLMTLAIEPEST